MRQQPHPEARLAIGTADPLRGITTPRTRKPSDRRRDTGQAGHTRQDNTSTNGGT